MGQGRRVFHSEEIAYGNTQRSQREGKGGKKYYKPLSKRLLNEYKVWGHESIYAELSEEHKTLFGLITQQTLTIVCRLPCILTQKPCNFSFI